MLISTVLLHYFNALRENMTIMTVLHFVDILWITFLIAYVIFNLICLLLCPDIARGKHRTAIGWFCFAFFLFGLSWIPLIIINVLKPKAQEQTDL